MRAVYEPRRGVLVFPSLFPAVNGNGALVRRLDAVLGSRTARALPAHKRIDGRRVRISCDVRHGDWSLTVTVRGANHEYGVRGALNLINELFLAVHETHPDYLIAQFGLSAE
jgi:hypothetical protein